MGIRSKWRAGHMKDPVSGIFKVSDWYDSRSSQGTRLAGVIIADGLPPTPGDAPVDHKGKWVGNKELPITVDRADPSNFRIEWEQVTTQDFRALAQQRALDQATKLAGGQAAIGMDSQPIDGGLASVMDALRSAGLGAGQPNVTVQVQGGAGGADAARAMLANLVGNRATMNTPATGVVRGVHDVVPVAPMPAGMSQADIVIEVTRPDGSTYPATTRLGFRSPARRAAIATLGTTVPLLVDPNDPGRLVIDVGRMNLP
jgi:hypothetical protein